MTSETDALAAERDLYKRLIELGGHDELDPLLDEALALVVELTGAERGVIVVREPGLGALHFFGCDAQDRKRLEGELSSGIVAEAIASRETVSTASARTDPRFSGNKSVQAARIEAVVCAPVGRGGALYLAGRRAPGPFGEREVRVVETCAKGLGPFLDRLAAQARRESRDATAEVRARMPAPGVIGRSPALARALSLAHVAASSDVAVLLLGETGSGKGAFARAIHDASARARGPFALLNCAAIPEALVESELFGAEKGAHSTATRKIAGKIAAAHGGTLFLDEMAELKLESQAKLLGFLQSKRFHALGATEPTEVDVRVVAATNADLSARVREKTFREDLFYRLSVLALRVPSIAERREDVVPLAEHFVSQLGGEPLVLSFAARAALAAADWPGNVREIEAAVQRSAAFARAERVGIIEPRHLFPDASGGAADDGEAASYQEQTRRFQAKLLREAIARARSATEAARSLGLSRSRFYELVRAHGIDPKPS